ncbi:MAG: hypothetical protein RLY16_2155 [Bacteroidota bacterium]|jgi:protein-tyrosine phosphatase/arsenate reductase
MFDLILQRCDALTKNFNEIADDRKLLLTQLAEHIQTKLDEQLPVNLVYVCTHNSRRSHLGQVWAAIAANYYGIEHVFTFSGGTEATAFNANAIRALVASGCKVVPTDDTPNPLYLVCYGLEEMVNCFSKHYTHEANPKTDFVAIMTCSEAEDHCPFLPGCDLRIGTTYHDPKTFDDTPLQDEKYIERSNQIAMECLYVFSKVNQK